MQRASGMMTSQHRSPRMSMAIRQSKSVVSQRARGAMTRIPRPMPADTTDTANPRFAVNHFVAVEVSGA